MTGTVEAETVARTKRNDTAVKVEASIIIKARHICVERDITLAEYLSNLLRQPVEADYQDYLREVAPSSKRKKD